MPLVPVDRLTGKPKALAEFSDTEAEHWADQIINEQKTAKMLNGLRDPAALDKADALAKQRNLVAVRQRIADARLALGAK